jgi:hypothetical protein
VPKPAVTVFLILKDWPKESAAGVIGGTLSSKENLENVEIQKG